ncbi:MAG: radical SAM protein [Candidatus Thiodiazotropha sp.]
MHSKCQFDFIRVQSPLSTLLGPQYKRSRSLLEIDLTWSCNLRCFNCNRSCEQMPTGERMEVEQIERFINETISANHHWKKIRLLGGEPTLHPQFLTIIDLLVTWRNRHSPSTILEVATNGYGEKVLTALAKLPDGIEIDNSNKSSRIQPFFSFNIAPIDRPEYNNAAFTNGCRVIKISGIGLTPYGWYPCAVAGSIDRIFGYDLGYKHIPNNEDDMHELLNVFCRLCGRFKRQYEAPLNKPFMSDTWELAYDRYKKSPPSLSKY